jgi:glycosyltransferase involved in cell wall biosynthesis
MAARGDTSPGCRVLVLFGAIPLYGQEHANIQVFDELRNEGVEALFLTNARYGHHWIHPELDRLGLRYMAVPFNLPPRRGMGLRAGLAILRDVWRTNRAFRRAVREFRPTHLHVMNIAYVLSVTPALFLCRVPLIYRIGDAPPLSNFLARWLWRRLARRCSRLVANSRFVRELCVKSGFPQKKIRHVYSAAPIHSGRSDSLRIERNDSDEGEDESEDIELQRDDSVVSFLYCGQIASAKGVHLVIESAMKLLAEKRPVRVFLAGNYSYRNPFALELVKRVKDAGLEDSIRFLGYVKNSRDLFQLADVHLCPSLWEEPLSNTVLEAKGAGIPSIIFPRGGLAETVTHGVDGWVCEQQTAEGVEEAMRFYLDHPAERRRHGEAALESARPEAPFGRARFRREWAAVFKETYA